MSQSVDLDQAAREQRAEQAAIEHIEAWEAEMNRIFKGIVPRPTRRRMMVESVERAERDA